MLTYPAMLSSYLDERSSDHTEFVDPLDRAAQTRGKECVGAQYHSPRPLFLVETSIVPLGWVAHNVEVSVVLLCGTCQDNLSVYQALLLEHDGEVPWSLRRDFGNMTRALGDQGWKFYREVHHA